MGMSLKVTIYLMTASVSLLSVAGNNGKPVNIKCDDTPVRQTAYLGGSVTINCTCPGVGKNQIKYFCKEAENFNCKNVISTYTSNYTERDRFSMIDHKEQEVYTVIISSLTQEDAGIYWCALKTVNNDSPIACLTKINLHIFRWVDIRPRKETHDTGENANLRCHYPHSHENNTKYLCKGENPLNCEELTRTTEGERDVTKDRFSIRDNKRLKYFYVYINNVSTADSGTYWCGSDRKWDHAEVNKIHLVVAERHKTTKKLGHLTQPTTATPSATTLHDDRSNYACCTSGGSSEQSIKDGQNTEENHGGHDYEEIQERNQEASSGGTLLSVYATVHLPTDQLHYASINFQNDSVTGSTDRNAFPDIDKNGSSACDYSSISKTQGGAHPPIL
ncbi:polymeric immunoglobulin receptor-like isoform X2 [Trachinotus anak]|uniref:polymeric immunoglobulin receptor-like isoform X2 n=1 Tax=Trachinotus anak TaxID=443729 RepID=UPI0039F18CA8